MDTDKQNQNGSKMGLIEVAKDYIENILQETQGRKALIMDKETLMMVSLVYSKTQILQREVFFMCTIDKIPDEKLNHLKVIFFLRPNKDNIDRVKEELKQPKFSMYNLYFTNKVESNFLQKLAESDTYNLVNQVQEVYLDYQAINPYLFSLNLNNTIAMTTRKRNQWTKDEHFAFNRMVDGLFAVLMSVRGQLPNIRYDDGSDICQMLAEELEARVSNDQSYIEKMARGSNAGETTILILDRREDPVTPLLNQWTYQAMIHELMGLKDNRVDLNHLEQLSKEMKEVVLSCEEDEFFKKIMYSNFGDVADSIHKLVQDFLKAKQSQAQFRTIEDMQLIIQNFPEFKKGERNTTKHFTIMEEMRKIVDAKKLYDISEIEQDLVCGAENSVKHFKAVQSMIQKEDTDQKESVRLITLYSLRYESDYKCQQLKDIVMQQVKNGRMVGASESELENQFLQMESLLADYAGKTQRKGLLFKEASSMINNTKKFLGSMFGDDVKNVLLQHQSWLNSSILESFSRGRLDEMQFPYFSRRSKENGSLNYGDRKTDSAQLKQTLIVFMVGGVTFEESKEVALFSQAKSQDSLNSQQQQIKQQFGQAVDKFANPNQIQRANLKIVLGGTSLLNSQTFLQEVQGIKDFYNKKLPVQPLELQDLNSSRRNNMRKVSLLLTGSPVYLNETRNNRNNYSPKPITPKYRMTSTPLKQNQGSFLGCWSPQQPVKRDIDLSPESRFQRQLEDNTQIDLQNQIRRQLEDQYREKIMRERKKFEQKQQWLEQKLSEQVNQLEYRENSLRHQISQKDQELILKDQIINSQEIALSSYHSPSNESINNQLQILSPQKQILKVSHNSSRITADETPQTSFWSFENIRYHTQYLKTPKMAMQIQNQTTQEFYKWTSIRFDEERDSLYHELNIQFPYVHPKDKVAILELDERKQDIRWDIAWQIFDEVNKDLHQGYEINLNCLDVEESLAIVKQKLYDVAQEIHEADLDYQMLITQHRYSSSQKRHIPKPTLLRVFSILCSQDHLTPIKSNDFGDTLGESKLITDNDDDDDLDVYDERENRDPYHQQNYQSHNRSGFINKTKKQMVDQYNYKSPQNNLGRISAISGFNLHSNVPYNQSIVSLDQSEIDLQIMNDNSIVESTIDLTKSNLFERKNLTKRNEVAFMIQNELELDIFYDSQFNLILVKIDAQTYKNPILSEW